MNDLPPQTPLAFTVEARCDVQAAREACRQAREFLAGAGVAAMELDAWELALTEGANNAVKHCPPECRSQPVRLELTGAPAEVEARIRDHTPGFDWPAEVALPPDDAESGRGLFLIHSLVDAVDYLRGRHGNCLVLQRRREPAGGVADAASASAQASAAAELGEARRTLDLMTEELASSYESLAAIFRFSAELQGGGTSPEFVHRWLDQLLAITDADWFVLRLLDRPGRVLSVAVASEAGWQAPALPVPNGEGDAAGSIEARAVARRSDEWFDATTPVSAGDPLAGLAAGGVGLVHPLFANDVLVGVLTVGRRAAQRGFAAGQASVVQTFGDFLGLQIRSAAMQEEQVRSRLDHRDLEIAAQIQRTLLPAVLPEIPGWSVAGFYRSARDIGGDYYDVLSTADGGLLLVVADVMGKGLPAALFASMFRSLVRARLDLVGRPGEFLAWLNRNLFHELDRSEMFITAQLAFFDARQGTLRVASAGHPPMLLAGTAGTVTGIDAGGPPLGILRDAEYPEDVSTDRFTHALLFTDGLVEARDRSGGLLGLDPVEAALGAMARAGEPAGASRDRLVQLLGAFEQGTAPSDDIAILLLVSQSSPAAHVRQDPDR